MATLLCCAAYETASCACCLGRCICCLKGKLSTKCANGVYLLILICMTSVAFALQEWGAPEFNFYSFNIGCKDIPGIDEGACKGENAVYRISMGLTLWFTGVAIGNICSTRVHAEFWGIKLVLMLITTTGLFFTPIIGQGGYVYFARVVSVLFLVTQIVSFIDAAYHWNAFFVNKASASESKCWLNLVLFVCFGIMTSVIASIVLLFIFYSCGTRPMLFITITSVLIIFATLIQLNTHDTDSSLLTSCIVATYVVYLCWSAVSAACPSTPNNQQLILGMFVTSCSLGWTCYSAADYSPTKPQVLLRQEDIEDIKDIEDIEDIEDTGQTRDICTFHIIMAVGSIYMSMLLTNWGVQSGDQSNARMWVSIASQWMSIGIYIWTLLAPNICNSREF